MGNEKANVMFFPGPARESRDGEVRREKDEPHIEPGRAVDVGARHFRVEARFVERSGDRPDDQDREEDDGQLERGEELENRISLPARARDRRGGHDVDGYFPREVEGLQRRSSRWASASGRDRSRTRTQIEHEGAEDYPLLSSAARKACR